MSEWYGNWQKPNCNFRKLLQELMDKAPPRHEITAEEQRRLSKLEAIAIKLTCGENVQNRQLQTWLSADEYAQVDIEWQEQLELREELKDKPDELCKVLNFIDKYMLVTKYLQSKNKSLFLK